MSDEDEGLGSGCWILIWIATAIFFIWLKENEAGFFELFRYLGGD